MVLGHFGIVYSCSSVCTETMATADSETRLRKRVQLAEEKITCPLRGACPRVLAVFLICDIAVVSLLSSCSDGQLIIWTDARITRSNFPSPTVLCNWNPNSFEKNTGTFAFRLNVFATRPVSPPRSCQL